MREKLTPKQCSLIYPITNFTLYTTGLVVNRTCARQSVPKGGRTDRKIKRLSSKSLSKLAFTVSATEQKFQSLITLTYPSEFPSDGKKVKRHWNKFITYFRRQFGKAEYVWFLEFQKRSAPHLHVFVTTAAPTEEQREKMAHMWAGIITNSVAEREKVVRVHSHKSAWDRIKSKHGAKAYALKYALKTKQKTVPKRYQNVGRFWGASKAVKPTPLTSQAATEDELRRVLRALGHDAWRWEYIPKYIMLREEINYEK